MNFDPCHITGLDQSPHRLEKGESCVYLITDDSQEIVAPDSPLLFPGERGIVESMLCEWDGLGF